MRTSDDAIRSVKRYLAQILSPQPTLVQLISADFNEAWTVRDWVGGCISLEVPAWDWLCSRDRLAATQLGSAEHPFLSSDLTETTAQLEAAAALEQVDLRLGEPANNVSHLPVQPVWEVRLAYDYGEVPEGRPFAVVGSVGSTSSTGSAQFFELQQPITLELAPLRPANAGEAWVQAMSLQALLFRSFLGYGPEPGAPIRVPLWDYESKGWMDPAWLYRHEHDYLRVEDFSVHPIPHPTDPVDVAVVADLRVSWRVENTVPDRAGVGGHRIVKELRVEGAADLKGWEFVNPAA
jgi:hypothetical protein